MRSLEEAIEAFRPFAAHESPAPLDILSDLAEHGLIIDELADSLRAEYLQVHRFSY